MTPLSAEEARRRFSEVVSEAFYQGKKTPIARNNKPVAWIVGDPFMQGLFNFFEYLIEEQPALADTLALLVDEKLRGELERGMEEYERGEAVPLESILDD